MVIVISLDTIYQKLADQATNRRTELLEWIIIVLIAIELVLPLVLHMAGER